jgi:uncharacterized protein
VNASTSPRPPEPWYRSKWPWILMAGPAFVVVGGAYAAWLAVSTSDGLVADDYYKRGMAINRTLARNDYSAKAGLAADVRIDAAGAVRVTLARADNTPEPAAEIALRITHPTRAGQDREATLVRDASGAFVGHVEPPGEGRRYVVIGTDAWRLSGAAVFGGVTEVRLAGRDHPE